MELQRWIGFWSQVSHGTVAVLGLSLLLSSCASHSDVSDLWVALYDSEQRVAELERQNKEMAELKDDSFAGIRAALIQLNQKLSTLEESNGTMRADFARLYSSVEDSIARLRSDVEKVSELSAQFEKLSERSSDYQQEYQEIQESLTAMREDFEKRISELELSIDQ